MGSSSTNKRIEDKSLFKNIKSKYILKKIFDCLLEKNALKIIKYNKSLKQRLDFTIDDYKNFSSIEIEVIPMKNKYCDIINTSNLKTPFYQIYFNNGIKGVNIYN